MSFKLLPLIFILLIFVISCGVKSPPVPPLGTKIPSYINNFYSEPQKNEKGDNKNKPNTESAEIKSFP